MNNYKLYTVYDNTDGGFTIWWQSYDRYSGMVKKKSFTVNTKEAMIKWKRELEQSGYKFVGKL